MCGQLSARYKCRDCGTARSEANLRQLHYHRGPFFERWRSRLLASFGVTDHRDAA